MTLEATTGHHLELATASAEMTNSARSFETTILCQAHYLKFRKLRARTTRQIPCYAKPTKTKVQRSKNLSRRPLLPLNSVGRSVTWYSLLTRCPRRGLSRKITSFWLSIWGASGQRGCSTDLRNCYHGRKNRLRHLYPMYDDDDISIISTSSENSKPY